MAGVGTVARLGQVILYGQGNGLLLTTGPDGLYRAITQRNGPLLHLGGGVGGESLGGVGVHGGLYLGSADAAIATTMKKNMIHPIDGVILKSRSAGFL
jgi:hypothetical protein